MAPTRRPGICRTDAIRAAMSPTHGPPKLIGMPSGWPSAATMSAP